MYSPSRLPENHYLHWMEQVIEKELGLVSDLHDAEHEAMKAHWNIKHNSSAPLNGHPYKETINGIEVTFYNNDREYHLLLHLKYWKEVGIFSKYVKRYEENGGNLEAVKVNNVF